MAQFDETSNGIKRIVQVVWPDRPAHRVHLPLHRPAKAPRAQNTHHMSSVRGAIQNATAIAEEEEQSM